MDPYAKELSCPRDRDSGVFLSELVQDSIPPTPTSVVPAMTSPCKSSTSPHSAQVGRRLRRPAELNLDSQSAFDSSHGSSQLEACQDLIRNSQTQSKATLISPTRLLQDRLKSPRKEEKTVKVRDFVPPRVIPNGCIVGLREVPFSSRDVCARTEDGKAAWWCKFDKLVVFDGLVEGPDGEAQYKTRSSKGLSIARRRGDRETLIIPIECAHCQTVLNRKEWRHDVQICRRSVCWECKERCRWEVGQQLREMEDATEDVHGMAYRDCAGNSS